jgi:glycosyltransferase involved in cell wall biosynthesis
MAAALPVVVSDFGYMRAIVREAGCGLLASPSDPQSHAAQLAALLAQPDKAQAMGVRGHDAVQRRYTWAGEGERLTSLYDELLGLDCAAPG